MNWMNKLGCVLICILSFQVSAQVDSMEIDGQYYKIYPFPENVIVHDDYWIAVKDKEYYSNPENYFQLYGEERWFSRALFDSANAQDLEMLNKILEKAWENTGSKDSRLGLGPRFVKQVRRHPEALVFTNYEFNKEVMPPFGTIPDGKYVQLFSEFCLVDSKGMCQPQTNRVAGYFDVKNNSIDGNAVWLNIVGDTIKQGTLSNGSKEGEWTMMDIDRPNRRLYRRKTKAFRKTGKFNNIDTVFETANFHKGILNGHYEKRSNGGRTQITGFYIDGEEAETWKTIREGQLVAKYTYADKNSEILSKRPIIRTSAFLEDTRKTDFYYRGYRKIDPPTDFYKIGFEEELDLELDEEGFKSHQLEYYGSFRMDKLPKRFSEERNFYSLRQYYDFRKDPSTDFVETRGYFIDSLGAKMLYEGSYELYYPNGQLFTKYQFENGELIDEGVMYWSNGNVHDEIEFVADSNHYVRRAYDYDGVLYRTAIYDSLGDFVKFDEETEKQVVYKIDGLEAKLEGFRDRTNPKFEEIFEGNYVYSNWDVLSEEVLDKETTLFKRWSGIDSSVIQELKYDPKTRTMTNFKRSYTGREYMKTEKVFTEDYKSWTGKTTKSYGDFTAVTSASAILLDKDVDTLPQEHLKYYYSHYDVTEDVEIFQNGKLYTGKVKIINNAPSLKGPKRKLVFHSTRDSGSEKIEKKLLKYFKNGRYKNSDDLGLVGRVGDCKIVNSKIRNDLFGVVQEGYFNSPGDSENDFYERKSDVKGYISDIKGNVVEGKPQGTWTGKSESGKLLAQISFDRGEPIGTLSKYAFQEKADKWRRARSDDSLPKRRTYYLYSTEEYENGMLNGPFFQYSWYGHINEKGTFKDDQLEGEYLSRYPMAYSKSNYKNGMLDGYVQTFLTLPRTDTILLYDLNFQHGLLNGKSLSYHTNGRMAKQGFFLDGESIDDYEAYDTLGFKYHYVKFKYSYPVEEKIWEENELSLRYTFDWEDSIYFDPSDITKSMSLESLMYKLGYGQSSLDRAYYGRPRLINKSGLKYHMTKYYPNDTIAREGYIDNGKKIGRWTFFDYEGQFLYEVDYFDSIIVVNDSVMFKSKGILTDFDNEGNKLYDAFIIEKMEKYDCAHTDHYEIRQLYTIWEANEDVGRMNGFVQNFYDNGVLQNEGNMKNGLPDGLWSYYDPFGKLNLMGTFHQGKRHGRWLSGDLGEKKYLGEICLNPNLMDLEQEKKYRENLLDITIINYHLGKALNKQFYDLNLNKYSNLKNDE